ncbi:hypothetical protein TNCV_1224581 [Trichonephila clavipes]|nr:hypothetical protein TNCV_1224581 [Trichonephila clavipes]
MVRHRISGSHLHAFDPLNFQFKGYEVVARGRPCPGRRRMFPVPWNLFHSLAITSCHSMAAVAEWYRILNRSAMFKNNCKAIDDKTLILTIVSHRLYRDSSIDTKIQYSSRYEYDFDFEGRLTDRGADVSQGCSKVGSSSLWIGAKEHCADRLAHENERARKREIEKPKNE